MTWAWHQERIGEQIIKKSSIRGLLAGRNGWRVVEELRSCANNRTKEETWTLKSSSDKDGIFLKSNLRSFCCVTLSALEPRVWYLISFQSAFALWLPRKPCTTGDTGQHQSSENSGSDNLTVLAITDKQNMPKFYVYFLSSSVFQAFHTVLCPQSKNSPAPSDSITQQSYHHSSVSFKLFQIFAFVFI